MLEASFGIIYSSGNASHHDFQGNLTSRSVACNNWVLGTRPGLISLSDKTGLESGCSTFVVEVHAKLSISYCTKKIPEPARMQTEADRACFAAFACIVVLMWRGVTWYDVV